MGDAWYEAKPCRPCYRVWRMMCGIYRPRAGCVVYRTPHDSGSSSSSDEKGADTQLKAQGLEILLIESSKKEGQWTLPGGGIHYGESKELAASRETFEEAGVSGDITHTLGDFPCKRNRTTTALFALKCTQEHLRYLEVSKRRRKWFLLADAVAAVKHKDTNEVFMKAFGKVVAVA